MINKFGFDYKEIAILKNKNRDNLFNEAEKEEAGIYLMYNVTSHRAYIGRSNNMRKRINTHFSDMVNMNHINHDMVDDYIKGDKFLGLSLMISEYEGEEKQVEPFYIMSFRDYAKEYDIKMYNYQYSKNDIPKDLIKNNHSMAIASCDVAEFFIMALIPFKYSLNTLSKTRRF